MDIDVRQIACNQMRQFRIITYNYWLPRDPNDFSVFFSCVSCLCNRLNTPGDSANWIIYLWIENFHNLRFFSHQRKSIASDIQTKEFNRWRVERILALRLQFDLMSFFVFLWKWLCETKQKHTPHKRKHKKYKS